MPEEVQEQRNPWQQASGACWRMRLCTADTAEGKILCQFLIESFARIVFGNLVNYKYLEGCLIQLRLADYKLTNGLRIFLMLWDTVWEVYWPMRF
mgnify:CR=1 FL=1